MGILSGMLRLNSQEYLDMPGLNVMLGQDFYPEGHQGGVVIIQNGQRVASNGDIRLEPCPGQWQPVPRQLSRKSDPEKDLISCDLAYPDPDKNRKGFNPINYPDLEFSYTISIRPQDRGFLIQVDLHNPLPPEWTGPVGFNLELFPGHLFGKAWTMTGESASQRGLFPLQPNGPGSLNAQGVYHHQALARGTHLTICPESDQQRMNISLLSGGELELLDGRGQHNNGWFIVRTSIPAGAATAAVQWLVEPHAMPDFVSPPIIQHNQAGYHPAWEKRAYLELDAHDKAPEPFRLLSLGDDGTLTPVLEESRFWGRFLRHAYKVLDFSAISTEGWYVLEFRGQRSAAFRIDASLYKRDIWQPVLEYFLPVQMCHMRVQDGYRVWHGDCHHSDALMAPVNHNHFDGYLQGPDTLCRFQPGDPVPGLNQGGWHDAGDFDLRIDSQAGTVHGLALAQEEFQVDWDNTRIDQNQRLVVMRSPDGIPDMLQQIEHGLLSILGGWKSLGRLYRGIIEADLEDYVLLGDPVNHQKPRLVFTQDNPWHEVNAAAALAAASRVMADYRPDLAREALDCALSHWQRYRTSHAGLATGLAVELLLCSQNQPDDAKEYALHILDHSTKALEEFARGGWNLVRALPALNALAASPAGADLAQPIQDWQQALQAAALAHKQRLQAEEAETPYGLPYRPHIWGAGWGIQHFGFQHYWLAKHLPQLFDTLPLRRAFDFVLGCHPGANNASLISGVGAKSVTTAYGPNRADWSHIPGGSVSGTALIRPDLPELLEWPYLWQQTEYVLGGGTTDWLFLALAMDRLS